MKIVIISLNDRGNLGARQVVAYLKRMGHEGYLINFGQYDHEQYEFSERRECEASTAALLKILDELAPEVVGFSYRSAMAWLAKDLAVAIRKNRDCRIMAGGIGATSDPYEARTWADVVCRGEADNILSFLLTQDSGIVDGSLITELDSVPFPDYTGETTWTIVNGQGTHPDDRLDNELGAYPLLTSRGCQRACSYCHNSVVHALYAGQKYSRQRSVGNVMEEIKQALYRWPIKLISIYDDLFIADPAWIMDFARQLPEVWQGQRRFWCMAHPTYIGRDVIKALVDVGLEAICLGVQSGSERILHLYRRGTSVEQILDACGILSEFVNLHVKIDIISANPLETEDDRLATIELIQHMPRKPTWTSGLSRLAIFPGAEIGKFVTPAQCAAMVTPYQDFVDGLYRGAFQPKWYGLDLCDALKRYDDFVAWKAGRVWPETQGPLSAEEWQPLTTWLNEGCPK